ATSCGGIQTSSTPKTARGMRRKRPLVKERGGIKSGVGFQPARQLQENLTQRHGGIEQRNDLFFYFAYRPSLLILANTSFSTQWNRQRWMLSTIPMSSRSTWMPCCCMALSLPPL